MDLGLPEQAFVTRLTLEQVAMCNADDIEVIDLKMHSSCILEQVSCNLCQSTLSCLACFLNFMIFRQLMQSTQKSKTSITYLSVFFRVWCEEQRACI